MMGSGCGRYFGEGSIFQLEGLKNRIFKQKEQFDQIEM